MTSLKRAFSCTNCLCFTVSLAFGSYSRTPSTSKMFSSTNIISKRVFLFKVKIALNISYRWCNPSSVSKSSQMWNKFNSFLTYCSCSMAFASLSLFKGEGRTLAKSSAISSSLFNSQGGRSTGVVKSWTSSNCSSSSSPTSCVISTDGSLPCT